MTPIPGTGLRAAGKVLRLLAVVVAHSGEYTGNLGLVLQVVLMLVEMSMICMVGVLAWSCTLQHEDQQRVAIPANGSDLLAAMVDRHLPPLDGPAPGFGLQGLDRLALGVMAVRRPASDPI